MATAEGSTGVGDRVRSLRKLGGLTQVALAQRANVSLSLVKQVEQGVVPASPMFVNAAAKALRVSTADLYHQPEPRFGAERADVADLETAVLGTWALHPDEPAEPIDQLRADLTRIADARRQCRYAAAAAVLPGMLARLHTAAAEGHSEGCKLLGLAYAQTFSVMYRLGSPLAGMAAERAAEYGRRSDDANLAALLEAERALVLIHRGAIEPAHRVLDRAMASIEDESPSPEWHSVSGFIHLRSAIANSRSGDAATADAHLREASLHAERLPDLSDIYWTAFCSTNVMIHTVAVPVELGNGSTALARNRPVQPGVLTSRQTHHNVDVARAWLLHGDRLKCFEHLNIARELGPQLVRYHPQVHEMLVVLAETDRRRTDSLAGFARWAGVAP